MPRYMVERTFPDGLDIPINSEGADAMFGIVDRNAGEGVTWVHSYVSTDKTHLLRLRRSVARGDPHVAEKNGLPVDAIHEVRVLDPYFYH